MIENSNDFYMSFTDLLLEAEEERMTFTPDKMLSFGIPLLDYHTLGIFPHDLVVIGADTGVGKSELSYMIALVNAKRNKKSLLFALEGNINEIAWRYTQRKIAESGVPVQTRDYRINVDPEVHDLAKAVQELSAHEGRTENLKIFNKKQVADLAFIEEMIRTTRDYFDLYVIDHLHYIDLGGSTIENVAIGNIMRTLQTTTGEVKKPIVLACHLKKRNSKEDPTKYDLHGSSNISKEATTIILVTPMDKFDNTIFAKMHSQSPATVTDRYSGTKFIVDKSRAGMPRVELSLIFDLWEKRYIDEYSEVMGEDQGTSFSYGQ